MPAPASATEEASSFCACVAFVLSRSLYVARHLAPKHHSTHCMLRNGCTRRFWKTSAVQYLQVAALDRVLTRLALTEEDKLEKVRGAAVKAMHMTSCEDTLKVFSIVMQGFGAASTGSDRAAKEPS